jgi:hypothetical protein
MPSATYDRLTKQIGNRFTGGLQTLESDIAVAAEKSAAIAARAPNLRPTNF